MCKKNKKGLFKLNNKGFAITSIIYSMLLLFIILMTLIILTLGRKKAMLDKAKNETTDLLGQVSNNYEYFYTGDVQTFVAPRDGYYNIELWGAQGGNTTLPALKGTGGKGAYTSGNIYLNQGDTLYIYVGGKGTDGNSVQEPILNVGGYNGGGNNNSLDSASAAGGGATDVRLLGGSYNSFDSLKSRIMVAGGGGGSGTLNIGSAGGIDLVLTDTLYGYNGSQTSGGSAGTGYTHNSLSTAGGFGYGGNSGYYATGAGGSGYYGGGGGNHVTPSTSGGGGGGSSFISGYDGCDAIASNSTENNIIHTGQSVHYSGKQFSNPKMIAGDSIMPTYDGNNIMLGNAGDGHAKITYVGKTPYTATNLIKNGSFENGDTNNFNNSFGSLMTKAISNNRYSGNYSMSLASSDNSRSEVYSTYIENSNSLVFNVLPNRYYYCSAMYLSPNSGVEMLFYPNNYGVNSSRINSAGPASAGWTKLSTYLKYTGEPVSFWFRLDNNNNYKVATSYFDDVLCLDLTETFGAGNEPTKEWCDENISYFDGTAIIYK